MSYSPPAGDELELDFTGAYSPPAGGDLELDFLSGGGGPEQSLLGVSVGPPADLYGTATVANAAQALAPVGIAPNEIDPPTFTGGSLFLAPAGFAGGDIGSPSLELSLQVVSGAGGFSSLAALGEPVVDFALRTLAPPSLPESAVGEHGVGFYFRFLAPGPLEPEDAIGDAAVDFRLRTLFPLFIPSGEVGQPRVRLVVIEPSGFESSLFGTSVVEDRRRFAGPFSIRSTAVVGTPVLEFFDRTIGPQGVVYTDVSPGTTFANRNRVLRVFQDDPSGVIGGALVLNRNRVLGPSGWQGERVANGQEYPYTLTTPQRYAFADDMIGRHQQKQFASLDLQPSQARYPFFRATGRLPVFIFTEGDVRYVVSRNALRNNTITRWDRWSGEYLGQVLPKLRVSTYSIATGGVTLIEYNPDPHLDIGGGAFPIGTDPFLDGSDPGDPLVLGENAQSVFFPLFYADGYLYGNLSGGGSTAEDYWGPGLTGSTDPNGRGTIASDAALFAGLRRIGPFTGGEVFSDFTVQSVAISGEIGTGGATVGASSFADRGNLYWQLDTLKQLSLSTGAVSSGAGDASIPAIRSHPGPISYAVTVGAWNYYVPLNPLFPDAPDDPPEVRRRDATTGADDTGFGFAFATGAVPRLYYDGRWIWIDWAGPVEDGFAIAPVSGLKAWDPASDTGRIRVFNRWPALGPGGFASSRVGQPLAAYRNRVVAPASWDSSFSAQWHVVLNSARTLRPTGAPPAQQWGLPDLRNLNRTIAAATVPQTSAPAAALVAYRVRTLGHWFPSTGSFSPLPTARLNPYPIAPVGWISAGHAAPDVLERFNIVFASSIVPRNGRVGEPAVLNRNRTLAPIWPLDTSFGRPTVWFRVRSVAPLWTVGSVVPRPSYIGTTLQVAPMSPASSGHVVGAHTVGYTSVTPFITRTLFVESVPAQPAPPGAGTARFGDAELRTPDIGPVGWASAQLGDASVRINTIAPETAQAGEARFGIARFIGAQRVLLSPAQAIDSLRMDAQRVTPHTIWATEDVTPQAIANHGGVTFELVDAGDKWSPANGGFRRVVHTISNSRRTVEASSEFLGPGDNGLLERFGTARAELFHRRIFLTGWRSSRLGLNIDIPTTPRVVRPLGAASSAVGLHTLARPLELGGLLRPTGEQSSEFGLTEVQNQHRQIFPDAIAPQTPGDPERVGPPILRSPVGWLSEEFGVAMVAYRIRTAQFEGWDSLEMDYRLSQRTNRFRVRNAVVPVTNLFPAQAVVAQSVDGLVVSDPTVYNRSHYIEVDCICPVGVSVPSIAYA